MNSSIALDIKAVQSISAVPTIMRVIAETTGLGWVCVSRVTPEQWTMCAVHDELGFGLLPGDEIDIGQTFCDQVRRLDVGVVIDDVSNDPVYQSHPIPKKFGFESYFSIPVYRVDGSFFGTLCGLDPKPAQLTTPKTLDTLKLFAQLLSGQLEAELLLADTQAALEQERQTAELREQFIAVLGHDLRTPLTSIMTGGEMIRLLSGDARVLSVVARIERSGQRIASLVDDVMDFTRGKMGGALPVTRKPEPGLATALQHVVAELRSAHPGRMIDADIGFDQLVLCDARRVAQLLSNLVVNALIHGSADAPVKVTAIVSGGRFVAEVVNAGIPIPADTVARLFQPFWRGPPAVNRAGAGHVAGLGLGLYIASEIARSHDGTLEVDSTPERTRFRFSFAA